MKVLLVWKALVVGAYQRKLEEIARLPDVELVAVVPPSWRDAGHETRLERLHVQGYQLVVSPIALNGSFHLFFFPQLGRLLDEHRPDLLHVEEEPYNLATFLALRQAAQRSIPSVFFTWQNLARRYPPPFVWMERSAYRTAAVAIAGTESAKQVLRHKGYRYHIAVIPQVGVDPDVFRPDSKGFEPGAPESKSQETPAQNPGPRKPFTIGFAGRLVPEKGVLLLLEACERLDAEFRLVILGAGPEEATIRARINALGGSACVQLAGAVPSSQMPARLQQLDAVVLPSMSRPNWIEQFGRILVEAMACGVPVVGSTCGEIPGVIGDAGLIFPEGDAAALAASLQQLASNAGLRADLGRRGRHRVLEHYTDARIAADTVAVYRRIVGQ